MDSQSAPLASVEDETTAKFPIQEPSPTHAAQSETSPHPELRAAIVSALRTVYDPEIPVNIYELGLIYSVDIDDAGLVAIRMTLTAPNCPAAGSLPGEAESKVRAVPGVSNAKVEVVWEPTWNKEMMSEAAKLELGFL